MSKMRLARYTITTPNNDPAYVIISLKEAVLLPRYVRMVKKAARPTSTARIIYLM